MLNVQDISISFPIFLEGVNNLFSATAAILGGICALKGMDYLSTLRQKRVESVFSFEIQLYAQLCEIKALLEGNDRLLTNLYSPAVRREWGDTRGVLGQEANRFYNCAQELLTFIKSTPNQVPVYETWAADYTELIKFLIDVLHFDIRDSENGFQFTEACTEKDRAAFCRAKCALLNRLIEGIQQDQNTVAKDLYSAPVAPSSEQPAP